MRFPGSFNFQDLSCASFPEEALLRVEECRAQLLSQCSALRHAARWQAGTSGKRLRPIILLCFAGFGQQQPPVDPDTCRAAAAIELLHEASLIHDDVVDRSLVRRGKPSVAEALNVGTAAHLGAFLAGIAVSALADVCHRRNAPLDLGVLRFLAQAQLEESVHSTPAAAPANQQLHRIIQGKTGSLFRLAAQVGAGLCPCLKARAFGERAAALFTQHLSTAFQLRDDLADLEGDPQIRKPGGNDLERGLPNLLFQIWADSLPDPRVAWRLLEECRNSPSTRQRVRQEIFLCSARREVRRTIRSELHAAFALLTEAPDGPARQTLRGLLDELQPDSPSADSSCSSSLPSGDLCAVSTGLPA